MTISPKVLYSGGQLAGAVQALFTVPANTMAVITGATFTNTDIVTQSFTIYLVRAGSSPRPGNILIDNQLMAPDDAYVSPEIRGKIMGPGDFLSAVASTGGKITCAGIDGYYITQAVVG